MKHLILIVVIVLSFNTTAQNDVGSALEPFIDYLESNNFPTASEYVLNKFKTKDIVIVSERDHRDLSQYDIIFDVLKSPDFKGNIYTEVGSSNNASRINKFLLNDSLTEEEKEMELLDIYRELSYDIVWKKYNYYALLNTVYSINKERSKEDKILLLPLDIEFDWKDYDCHSQFVLFDEASETELMDREIIMGRNFVQFFEFAKRRNPERSKALVILNTYHGYTRIPTFLPNPTEPSIYSAGEYIYKTYPEITTNIYINYYTQNFSNGLSNSGLLDAAFATTQTDNIGFDLENTPFGKLPFDLYNFGGSDYAEVSYNYIFEGMIFYKPVADMTLVTGIPNVYPEAYKQQFYERWALVDGISYEKSLEEYASDLKEVNTVRYFSLPEVELQKIQEQINFWIN